MFGNDLPWEGGNLVSAVRGQLFQRLAGALPSQRPLIDANAFDWVEGNVTPWGELCQGMIDILRDIPQHVGWDSSPYMQFMHHLNHLEEATIPQHDTPGVNLRALGRLFWWATRCSYDEIRCKWSSIQGVMHSAGELGGPLGEYLMLQMKICFYRAFRDYPETAVFEANAARYLAVPTLERIASSLLFVRLSRDASRDATRDAARDTERNPTGTNIVPPVTIERVDTLHLMLPGKGNRYVWRWNPPQWGVGNADDSRGELLTVVEESPSAIAFGGGSFLEGRGPQLVPASTAEWGAIDMYDISGIMFRCIFHNHVEDTGGTPIYVTQFWMFEVGVPILDV